METSKRSDGQARGKYTLEFKLEAVRLVKGGQAASVTATVLGIPNHTLDNWEQIELARLRQERSRVKMERGILKKSDGVPRAGITAQYAWTVEHKKPVAGPANVRGAGGQRQWLL